MEIINSELRIVLGAYVKEWINLGNFKEWFATNVWDLLDSPSPLDRMVVGELQIAIAEFDRGDRDAQHVKEISVGFLFILNAVQHALNSATEIAKPTEIFI